VIARAADGLEVTATVTLIAPAVATVTVAPSSFSLRAGSTARVDAVARDATYQIIPGASFVWSSSDPAIATVNAAGMVNATGVGVATITATASNGASGSTSVTVLP
jgi:uncharacterized protein YjdB